MTYDCRDYLVAQIKDAGQELINRAESMVGEGIDYVSDFTIYINIGQRDGIPEIEWSVSVLNKTAANRLNEKE